MLQKYWPFAHIGLALSAVAIDTYNTATSARSPSLSAAVISEKYVMKSTTQIEHKVQVCIVKLLKNSELPNS